MVIQCVLLENCKTQFQWFKLLIYAKNYDSQGNVPWIYS